MSCIVRDLIEQFPHIEDNENLRRAIRVLHPDDVVIGGTYEHFKGKEYKVLGIVKDADNWDGPKLVRYVQTEDASHECIRPITEFLSWEIRPEYTGPRFKLVSV